MVPLPCCPFFKHKHGDVDMGKIKESEVKKSNVTTEQQITIWLTMTDLGWLVEEKKRLSAKGWKVGIREDGYGRIALWRTR